VFPVRYEHHLHIENKAISVNRPWRPVRMFPVKYEYDLHIIKQSFSLTGHGGA
jgi:hypothetical protein